MSARFRWPFASGSSSDNPPAGSVVEPGAEVLPGYRVVGLLTHGRRMDTYDAYDVDRDCRVVVKVLRPDRRHEERVRRAVLTEGEIVTTLSHPHLVRGYAAFDEPPAVVLETLSGATLAALIDDDDLAPADAAQLGLHLVSALGYLHRHGWLHLDVKPSNVVVRHGLAILIDLSLASRFGRGRPGAGTRGYLSPEQARGIGLTPAADVWGLGITLIEALTGELPYGEEATWDAEDRGRLLPRRMPRARKMPTGLSEEFDRLLRACIAFDPADRPTLAEVRAVLAAEL